MEHLSSSLVYKTLGYHGQPLQKIWEGERGENDLARHGVINPDFSTYQARQKSLTFQDRAKRLKLHQFISKKATNLFDISLVEEVPRKVAKDQLSQGKENVKYQYNRCIIQKLFFFLLNYLLRFIRCSTTVRNILKC